MKRVYALYRVSTKGQVDHDDIPMQKTACRNFAEKMEGWQICKEFMEKGVSGFKVSAEDRDAIQDLKSAAEKKEFDVLLVFMFDRLGRIQNETPFVLEWFVKNGIEVWSTKEGQQTFENDSDYLMNYIRFWQAGGESRKTSIRVKERLSQLVENGEFTGGCCPYGYNFVKSGEKNKKGRELVALQINPEEKEIVKYIFNKTVNEGYGTYRLCRELNGKGYKTHSGSKFQANTINRILKNYLYAGYYVRSGKISPFMKKLKIIDKEIIDRAQEILKARVKENCRKSSIAYTTRGKSLLSGNIFCAHCGEKMYAISYQDVKRLADGSKKVYKGIKYVCPNRARKRGECDGKTQYTATVIDKAVLEVVNEVLGKIKSQPKDDAVKTKFKKLLEDKKAVYNGLLKEHERTQEVVRKLLDEVGKSLIGESKFDINTLNESLTMQKQKVSELERKIPLALKELNDNDKMLESIDSYYNNFKSWSDEFEKATTERKKMIICSLFNKIEIGKNYEIRTSLNLEYGQFVG